MGLLDSIIAVESGGNPNAANPSSSASGLGQFIDSTWLSTIRKHRPDLAGGKTDQELLALKTDPGLSKEMIGAYASDNQSILSKAGLPVTDGTTYLAHFAGPQGAVKVLSSSPDTPVSAILGASAVKANPFLNGMTAADLISWAGRKMGGGAQQQAAPPQQQQASNPQVAPQHFAPPPEQQVQAPQSIYAGIPISQIEAPPPIFVPPKRQVDLSKLKAALASGNRGLFFGRG